MRARSSSFRLPAVARNEFSGLHVLRISLTAGSAFWTNAPLSGRGGRGAAGAIVRTLDRLAFFRLLVSGLTRPFAR
jgi:hypothetical protein